MIKMNVDLGDRGYPIYVTLDFSGLGKACASAKLSGKMMVITDSNVDKYYCDACVEALSETGAEVSRHVIQAGENSKNLDTLRDIYRRRCGRYYGLCSSDVHAGHTICANTDKSPCAGGQQYRRENRR